MGRVPQGRPFFDPSLSWAENFLNPAALGLAPHVDTILACRLQAEPLRNSSCKTPRAVGTLDVNAMNA
jgi:hypothetical protein